MNRFTYYDLTGILAPGAVLLVGVLLLFADLRAALLVEDFSVGGLGLFVILAYVTGQLTQAVGNVLEKTYWKMWGGMPTDWVRSGRRFLLASEQVRALETQLPTKLGYRLDVPLAALSQEAWFSLTRQIYAAIAAEGRAGRVDMFNGNYGLNRGVGTALLLIAALTLLDEPGNGGAALGLGIGAVVAGSRMHRFAVHYGRELFIQFLQLPIPISNPSAP